MRLQIGQRIQIRAYKSDGTCYRRWYATVEALETDLIIVVAPVGHQVEEIQGVRVSAHAMRVYYWLNKWYSLLEVYDPDGTLVEVYVNISSPVEIGDTHLSFTDYELDVSLEPPHEAQLIDEDEFLEAVSLYAYSQEFQQTCYQVATEAIDLANRWVARGMPTIEA